MIFLKNLIFKNKKNKESIKWDDYSAWIHIDDKFTDDKVEVALSEARTFMYLEAIKVKENYRNQLVGTKKMIEIVHYAKQRKKSIILKVSDAMGSDINRLKEFYQRFGFVEGELIETYRHNMFLYIEVKD